MLIYNLKSTSIFLNTFFPIRLLTIKFIIITEEDPPEYDVAERVRLLNEQLANEPEPDHDRTRSIQFKDNLVDLVAPPPDYSSFDVEEDEDRRGNGAAKDSAGSEDLVDGSKDGDDDTNQRQDSEPSSVVDDKIKLTNNGEGNTDKSHSPQSNSSSPEANGDYENDFEDPSPTDMDSPRGPSPVDPRVSPTSPASPRTISPRSPSPQTPSPNNSPLRRFSTEDNIAESSDTDGKSKDEKVLIERDGKFELVSVSELKDQGLYPDLDELDQTDGAGEGGDSSKDEEKVLIERNGKFEMVSAAELKAQGLYPFPELSDEISEDSTESKTLEPTPPPHPRPATAAGLHRRLPQKSATRRAQSAKQSGTAYEGSGQGLYDEFNYTSPYAMTSELRQEMRHKRYQQLKEQERLDKEKKHEEEDRQRNNNEAFEYWLKTKRKEASLRRNQETKQKDERKSEEEEKKKVRIFHSF